LCSETQASLKIETRASLKNSVSSRRLSRRPPKLGVIPATRHSARQKLSVTPAKAGAHGPLGIPGGLLRSPVSLNSSWPGPLCNQGVRATHAFLERLQPSQKPQGKGLKPPPPQRQS
jgi:hypothetical protein